MTQQIAVEAVALSGQNPVEAGSAELQPASPGAVQKFNELMFAGGAAGASSAPAASPMLAGVGENVTAFVEGVSQRWREGQEVLKNITAGGEYGVADMAMVQMQMMNIGVDVELASKTASVLENGIQTVMQRGGG